MKAITLIQPWASLVAVGEKRIETRSWATNYRGPIAIHASASMTASARAFARSPEIAAILHRRGILDLKAIPLGCVVATAELIDVVHFGRLTEDVLRRCGHLNGKPGFYPGADHEHLLGDFTAGRFGFVLANVQEVRPAIPAKGMLGLWNWDDPR